ncbi:MAG: hypothetical protein K2G23_10105, partial [Muribaculaceae bacterium]|nr:hypothetical protein [Muribaculaceae bacterium]
MKGIKIFLLVAMLAGVMDVGIASNNHIQFNASFDTDGLNLTTITKDGVEYTEISLEGLNNGGDPGHPYLPVQSFNISVPADASDIRAEVTVINKERMTLTNPPLPAQYPVEASVDYQEPPFLHLVRQSSSGYPQSLQVVVNEVFTIGGFNKVAGVLLSPVLWNESDNSIELATDIQISLSWTSNSDELDRMSVPFFQEAKENAFRMTREIVINPEDVLPNSKMASAKSIPAKAVSGNEYVPYVIVTTEALASNLERLAAFRRLRGFQTRIYTIEEILKDSKFAKGDEISGINDDAGKLRAFITYVHSSLGTQYVLLAGEYPKIPGRWADKSNEPYVTDQYYRDITNKWNIPSNSPINPYNLSGISQDICVGRISLKNPRELDNYLDKLIQYEFNLKDVDLSYLGNAFVMCGHDQSMHTAFDNYSLRYYQTYFSYLQQLRIPKEGIVSGHEAVSEMKSNNWGFVDWRCHGHYAGVGTSKKKDGTCYGINALDNDSGKFLEEPLNGLDTWGNKDHPCWTLSMSCNLAEIGYGHDTYNFAESFILGKDYGGVAFIGNSGPGHTGDSSLLIQTMMDEVCRKYSSKLSISYAGDIFSDGLIKTTVTDKHVKATIGITGDPLTPLWLKPPFQSNIGDRFRPTAILNTDSVNYSRYNFSSGTTQTGRGLVSNYASTVETTNYTLLNTRTDMLPYIHPTKISSLKINNKDGYWFVGKLRFEPPKSSKDGYSLQLTNNRNVDIEALGLVEINGKMILDKGTKLNIMTHQSLA